jgi:hypothetical protein
MAKHRPSTRILIVLCLLALQAQMVASSAMACKHSRMAGDQTVRVCPYHVGDSVPRGAGDTDEMLDCQKCVLGVFFGVHHPMPPASLVGVTSKPPLGAGIVFKHFYLFVPDRLYRPPISSRI